MLLLLSITKHIHKGVQAGVTLFTHTRASHCTTLQKKREASLTAASQRTLLNVVGYVLRPAKVASCFVAIRAVTRLHSQSLVCRQPAFKTWRRCWGNRGNCARGAWWTRRTVTSSQRGGGVTSRRRDDVVTSARRGSVLTSAPQLPTLRAASPTETFSLPADKHRHKGCSSHTCL